MADPDKSLIESGSEIERTVFFSDAVFAIAITLLAFDIRVPDIVPGAGGDQLRHALVELLPKLYSFLISFWIIGMYWLAHHRIFHFIKGYDRRLLVINFFFLMWIVLIPFSASLLGEYGSYQLALIIYFSHMILASLSLVWVWWYAYTDRRLVDPDLDPAVIRYNNARLLNLPIVFLIAIVISFFNLSAAGYSVLLLFFLRPITLWFARRRTA